MISPPHYIQLLVIISTSILFLLALALWHSPIPEEKAPASHSSEDHRDPQPIQALQRSLSPHDLINQLKFHNPGSSDFGSCNMSNCFDYSKCRHPGPMRVSIVPSKFPYEETINETLVESNLIHQKILQIVKESKHYEPNLDKACIFILKDDTLDRDPLSQSFRPELVDIISKDSSYGMNHLVFNLYSGTWPDYREDDFAGLRFGAAIMAKASTSVMHHRRGFDISLPLFLYQHPDSDSDLNELDVSKARDRNLFLIFKGKRYIYGSGGDTRNSVYHIDNHRDIIMLTTCRHGKKWRESTDVRCSEDDSRYGEFDYVELMRMSKFCLVPRGRRLGSFRFLEALSFGCIPVVLSDNWILPFDEVIDWSLSALQFNESQLLFIGDILRDFTEADIDALRENGLSIYQKYFSTKERIVLTTLSIIEKRINTMLQGA